MIRETGSLHPKNHYGRSVSFIVEQEEAILNWFENDSTLSKYSWYIPIDWRLFDICYYLCLHFVISIDIQSSRIYIFFTVYLNNYYVLTWRATIPEDEFLNS